MLCSNFYPFVASTRHVIIFICTFKFVVCSRNHILFFPKVFLLCIILHSSRTFSPSSQTLHIYICTFFMWYLIFLLETTCDVHLVSSICVVLKSLLFPKCCHMNLLVLICDKWGRGIYFKLFFRENELLKRQSSVILRKENNKNQYEKLMYYKFWGFHSCDCSDCHLLACDIM
jgi:hypothetical protein